MNFRAFAPVLLPALFPLVSVCAHADADGTYPLSSIRPDAPISELAPLSDLADQALIVGIGEVSHGTINDTSRFRLAKYLIEEKGYRLIFAEHSMGTTLDPEYQNFTQTCVGDPDAFMRAQSSPVFVTKEYAEFFQWLCQYNFNHSRHPVTFVGIDFLNDPFLLLKELDRATAVIGDRPDYAAAFASLRQDCFGARYSSRKEFFNSPEYDAWSNTEKLETVPHQSCLRSAAAMTAVLAREEALLRATLGDLVYAVLSSMPRSLAGHDIDAADYASDITGSQSIRDQYQYDNLRAMWDAYGRAKKAILFEHNYHVAKKQSALPYSDWPNVLSVGELLSRDLGADYRAIGFTGYAIQAYYMPNAAISDAPNSLDLELNGRAADHFLVDARGTLADSKEWAIQGDPHVMKLSDQFDFLFYSRNVSPATQYFPPAPAPAPSPSPSVNPSSSTN